jgi:PAS domain S-box-containing protein
MFMYTVIIFSILLQFAAAFLAVRLVWITKTTISWLFIATAIFLMALRRCFTFFEWYMREQAIMPLDISSETIGLATSMFMLVGVALIAPLFLDIKRSEQDLKERVEEKTVQLRDAIDDLQLELFERQQAEEALRKSEERFRTLAEFTYDWEYWLSPEGHYNYISPSVERITGYSRDQFLQEPGLLERITHPDDQELVNQHVLAEPTSLKSHMVEFRIITKDGEERWISHVCQPVSSVDGRNLGRRVSNRDVTPRKRAEAAKIQLESQLRQAQKMEAIGTLAGGIAHDFNNILSPIIMYTEIALKSTRDEDLRPYLDQVLKSSRRASDLVKQILAISRQTEPQPIIMQLGPLVKETLKLLRASFPATIELRQHLVPSGDWILADPTEIYQVVMNLCTNAAHAMADMNGVLDVSLDLVDLKEEQSAFGMNIKPGAYVRFSVKDTGHGIPPEVLDRIFEPYFTTKEIGQGTGLGLALVHSVVQACNGGITVVSEPHQGTTFHIFFPRIQAEVLSESEDITPLPQGCERVLLVDDEADIVSAVQTFLGQAGYKVVPFTDSRKALAAFQTSPENFDLVITDLTMPHLTGLDLARELLQLRPHLPIIICTGYGDPVTIEKIKPMGIREIIFKPIIPRNLAEAIHRVLNLKPG